MSRVLIVYFSRGGHTRRVAEELAANLGADLEAMVDTILFTVASPGSLPPSRSLLANTGFA